MRLLLPLMVTIWQWCSRRSIRTAAITSSPNTSPHYSKPLLEVRMVEAASYLRVISWKKSIAPVC